MKPLWAIEPTPRADGPGIIPRVGGDPSDLLDRVLAPCRRIEDSVVESEWAGRRGATTEHRRRTRIEPGGMRPGRRTDAEDSQRDRESDDPVPGRMRAHPAEFIGRAS